MNKNEMEQLAELIAEKLKPCMGGAVYREKVKSKKIKPTSREQYYKEFGEIALPMFEKDGRTGIIAKKLNEKGIKTLRGRLFNGTTVGRILKSKFPETYEKFKGDECGEMMERIKTLTDLNVGPSAIAKSLNASNIRSIKGYTWSNGMVEFYQYKHGLRTKGGKYE